MSPLGEAHGDTCKEAPSRPKEEEEEEEHVTLHPFVDWAQTRTHLSLQVNLEGARQVLARLEDSGRRLSFSAIGRGVHGLHQYSFSVELFAPVDASKAPSCHSIERYVLLLVAKSPQQANNWPRLTRQVEKLAWLRVDFTRYLEDCSNSETDAEEDSAADKPAASLLEEHAATLRQRQHRCHSNTNQLNQKQQQRQPPENPDIFNPFNRRPKPAAAAANMKYDYRKEAATGGPDNARNTAKHAYNFKKTYLFLYNLIMFIMFLKVFLVLVIKGLAGGGADDDTVQGAARIVKILTFTQLLETLHPMLGLVPGGPLMPFTQVIGRLLVNHFLTEDQVRRDSAPYAHYLFVVWSCIEIFRYSFYALRVFRVNIYPITWCRYTLFLPLYPMGGFCESMVIFATVRHHEPLGTWSLTLPNQLNVSFSFPLAMKIYTYFLLGPTIYYLMCYMWRQRCKQLKEKLA